MNDEQRALQLHIRLALGVADAFDALAEIERRVEFLAELLRARLAPAPWCWASAAASIP
ncbi:hypothetical protein CDEN61S_04211 [Castellaniella denitrificans]